MEITTKTIEGTKTEELRREVFKLIVLHEDLMSMDQERFTFLLGYYPAIYNYLSELFTFMIARVRELSELNERYEVSVARDKKDVLEQALKSCKLQYEALSRKVTLLVPMERRD